jgi:hypothetical protein
MYMSKPVKVEEAPLTHIKEESLALREVAGYNITDLAGVLDTKSPAKSVI